MNNLSGNTTVGLQNGVFAGFLCIIWTLILYLVNSALVLSFWIFVGYVFIILFKVLSAHSIRKSQNNYITFREGLRTTFLVSVIGLLIWIVFNAILFSYIDPELIAMSKEKAIERTVKWMDIFGAPEDAIEDAVERAEKQDYSPTLKNSSINYASSLIIGFIYSLIIAGIFHLMSKGNKPQYFEESQEQPA